MLMVTAYSKLDASLDVLVLRYISNTRLVNADIQHMNSVLVLTVVSPDVG